MNKKAYEICSKAKVSNDFAKVLYKLYNEIERALVNYRVKYERRKDFEGYLQIIKKIRGY